MIEIIKCQDIPDSFLKNEGKEKFAIYPVIYNGVLFHKHRWAESNESMILFWAVTENGKLKAVLEFHQNSYDSELLGLKAGCIQNIFTDPDLDHVYKKKIWNELINSFQLYRQQEGIRFCFIALNNWEADKSLLLQEAGFRYILSWGKCFVQDVVKPELPAGYTVRLNKVEQELSFILDMAKSYFKGGRYYLDLGIGVEKADLMYMDLIRNSFHNSNTDFAILYNQQNKPVGCFLCPQQEYRFEESLQVAQLRLLVLDKRKAEKGIATGFLAATVGILREKVQLIESGIEMHNLPSLKIHINAGFRFNYIYSAYHSWL